MIDSTPRMTLDDFIAHIAPLSLSSTTDDVLRPCVRTIIGDGSPPHDLVYHLAGQLPYFYREPARIAEDFAARHNALEMLADLVVRLPTHPQFQNSHSGEILAALFLEEHLGLTPLYCKLSLTTSQNTNAHKMDAFFVDLSAPPPYRYFAVEAKCSVQTGQPHGSFRGHRNGILRQLVKSLDSYTSLDHRFDFALIRDNLAREVFTDDQRSAIRRDLVPPGPPRLTYLGTATINRSTVSVADDDYILTVESSKPFEFHSLALTDLGTTASRSYAKMFARLPDPAE